MVEKWVQNNGWPLRNYNEKKWKLKKDTETTTKIIQLPGVKRIIIHRAYKQTKNGVKEIHNLLKRAQENVSIH